MNRTRLLPLSGIVFVALVLLAIIGFSSDTPESGDSGATIASYYDDHGVASFIAAFLYTGAALFAVLFGVSVAGAAARAELDRPRFWERVLVVGTGLTAGVWLLAGWVLFALADQPTKVSGETLQALNLLASDLWVPGNAALGVLMVGAAGTLLTSAILPRWLGWAALPLGVALFIPFVDFIALLLSAAWIIVASILLFRAAEPSRAVAPHPA